MDYIINAEGQLKFTAMLFIDVAKWEILIYNFN